MHTATSTSARTWLTLVLLVALTVGCSGGEVGRKPLTAELPLHLEEHLDGSGMLTIPDMVRAGLWINLIGIVLVSLVSNCLVSAILG